MKVTLNGNFLARTVSSLHMQPDIQKSGGRLTYPFIFIANVAVIVAIGLMVKGYMSKGF